VGVLIPTLSYMSMLNRMSTRTRTTVSLPVDLVAHARAASGGNLSAYIEHALRAQQLRDAALAVRAWRERAALDTEEFADIFGEDVA
jgi:post-segregation antitoxin (ccd killing protein)